MTGGSDGGGVTMVKKVTVMAVAVMVMMKVGMNGMMEMVVVRRRWRFWGLASTGSEGSEDDCSPVPGRPTL